jgi:hypothetical protein
MCETRSGEELLSGPKVEDLEDGMVRIQIDQVMPWSVAVQILDLMADTLPDQAASPSEVSPTSP